ncbi:MAG: trypsin-like serine protease [Bdellovibrionales bacterium]
MNTWIGVFAALFLWSWAAQAQLGPRIVNGAEVEEGSEIAQQTVLLEAKMMRASFICTAVILNEQVLMTAAHCLGGNFWADIVAHFTVKKQKTGIRLKVVNRTAVRWPLPADTKDWDDIALLKLERPIPTNYRPVRLQNLPVLGTDSKVILAGYGRYKARADNGDGGAGILRWTEQNILEFPYGAREVRINIEGGGTCHGDSGGPVFVEREDGLDLMGIASRLTVRNKVSDGNGRNPPEYACLYDIIYGQVWPHATWVDAVLKEWGFAPRFN